MMGDMKTPLMVTLTISNSKVGRTLVDGRSSLNLMLSSTLDQMQILRSKSKNIAIPFFIIVPGSSTTPIGQVVLLVTFGTADNFHTKMITFNVIDAALPYNTKLPYNAILGHPVLIKFMAADHYTYRCMKIP